MADTSSNVQFKVENGLLVLGTANVAGPAVFNSNVDINGTYISVTANLQSNLTPVNNTYALGNTTSRWALNAMTGNFAGELTVTGNTTITGFANVSSSLNVTGAATVNGAFTVNNTANAGNTTITGFINVSSTANVGGAVNLRSTLDVNGAVTIPNTVAVGNTTITGFANIISSSATFNALTGVANTTDYITTAAVHGFSNGDVVRYVVSTGNTAITGLTNGSNYYVVSANTTAFQLATTFGGANINLTAGTSETGHTLTPQRIMMSTSGNIESPLGLANVGSLRVLGTATVNGAVTLSNTLATGNTTITGFANVTSTLNVNGAATVNGAFTVNNTASIGNTTITGFANLTGAATVNGALVVNNTAALGNTTITGFANVVGPSAIFNANTGVANTTDFITTQAAHGFSDGDLVRYVVSTGNTAITGLTNGSNYFVVTSNSTVFKLSSSYNGSPIDLTAGVSETGHTLVPQRIRFSNTGNIDSSIGLANVASLRVLSTASITGAATVNGAFTVNNTAAVASTLSVTGAVTFSNTLSATGAVTFSNTLSATGAVTFSNTIAVTGNVTFSNTLAVTGNTTFSNTINIVGIATLRSAANVVGAAATFNALTGVANTTEFITTTAAHGFSNGDLVQYIVSAGNTAVTGLANGTSYYVVEANSTAFKLSSSYGGTAINLTASISEVGHTLTPQRIILSTNGNIDSSLGLANVGSLRVLGTAVVNGAVTLASTLGVTGAATFSNTISVTGSATLSNTLAVTGATTLSNTLVVSGNATFDTDLLFLDAVNNRIGFKNTTPSSTDLITISGNTVLTGLSAAIRFLSSNATHNASITIAGNTTNTRTTFTTYEANATASDGGFIFQAANSSTTTSVLAFNQTELKYKTGNVAHAGNFGIYDVNGTRLGP